MSINSRLSKYHRLNDSVGLIYYQNTLFNLFHLFELTYCSLPNWPLSLWLMNQLKLVKEQIHT